jgi:hypothetical protein
LDVGHRLFTFASVLSLMLCILLKTAQMRSGDVVWKASNSRCILVESWHDLLIWQEFTNWPTTEPLTWRHVSPLLRLSSFDDAWVMLDRQGYLATGPEPFPYPSFINGKWHWSKPMKRRVIFFITFSNWIAVTALLPAAWVSVRVWKVVNNYRHRLYGRCVYCGYNLTGNTSGVCPECGTPVAKAST